MAAVPPPGGHDAPGEEVLSRERIVEAALGIVDRQGLERLSMRRLARALGTAPMSLYRHVRDKDELLALVADAVAARMPEPSAAGPWDDTVAAILTSVQAVLVEHDGVASLLTNRAMYTPATLRAIEHLVAALRAGGLSTADTARAVAALWTATAGAAIIEQSVRPATAGGEEPGEEPVLEAAARHADHFPGVAEVARHWAKMRPGEVRTFMLELLLDGLRARGTPEEA